MKFQLDTEHPVALDSPDHISPLGTMRDNSINLAFNRTLREINRAERRPSVLDFGCAGGGMVRTLIEQGHIAVGLEGSDYNLKIKRAEWAAIPEYLFTCDVGFPFTLHTGDGKPYHFDVITAWEFLEHMPEKRLDQMIDNMRNHLKGGGLIIGSISNFSNVVNRVEHHLIQKPMWWWAEAFGRHWFKRRPDLESRFEDAGAWVRKVHFNFVFQEDEY